MRLPTDRAAIVLARLYQAAEAQLQALIEQAIVSGALGTARYRQTRLAEVQTILAELNGEAVPEATQLIVDAYQLGGQIAGLRGEFGTAIHQEAVELLADALTSSLNDATERVGRQVDDVFRREGLRHAALDLIEGGTQREAAKRLRDTLVRQGVSGFQDRAGRQWGLANYAEMVVRTTTREAVSVATKNAMLERGDDLVTISSHHHESDVCDRYDGKTFSLTGATEGHPVLDQLPPFHPNFLTSGTRVRSVGFAVAGSTAEYVGPLVHLATASGVELAVGPEHPVLTARGWLPAKFVSKGDYVVRCLAGHVDESPCAHEQLNDRPATIEQILDALHALGDHARIPAAASHFHGDGRGCQGEVDVVWTDRLLRDELDPTFSEQFGEAKLVSAAAVDTSFAGLSAPLDFDTRCGAAAGRHVGGDGGGRTDLDTLLAESLAHGADCDTGILGELTQTDARHVALDVVVDVRNVATRCHAMDVQTSSGVYWANTILLHNCVHVLTPAAANLDALERELGLAQPALVGA